MFETLFNWLIEQQLLISSLVLSLLILERYSLKWLSANFVYKLWLLIPISLVLTNLPAHLKPLHNAAISKMLITPEQVLVADFSVSWAVLYTLVFSLLAAIAAVTHRRFVKQLKLTRLESCDLVHTYSGIQLFQSDTIKTPMVIGLLRTQLVLPTGYIHKIDSASFAMIIEHEHVHMKRADNLLNMMQLTITFAFWFNPLAWLGYMSFRRLQELSCDETVLANKNTQQRILYSKALINCAANTRASLMAYSHYGDKNTMLQRLKHIKHSGNSSLVAKGVILIFAAGMLSSFATAKQTDGINKVDKISPIIRIEPVYPTQAAEQNVSGSVVLKYDISPTGKTQNVSVVSASPENVFNREAKRALKKWEYKPSDSGFKNVLVQLDFAIDANYESKDLVEKITVASK